MKDYYAYKSFVRNKESFCLLPLNEQTVFVDGMYYPEQKFVLLLTRAVKERFQMIPKVDDFGMAVTEKSANRREKQDRIRMDTNYEHYMSNIEDIKWFADKFIENGTNFIEFVEKSQEEVVPAEQIEKIEPIIYTEPAI